MEVETGFSMFFGMFFSSFKWIVDGSGIMWLQLITTLAAVYFAVRKDHPRSKQFVKIMFIVSFWGTLYGVILSMAAVSNPALPADQRGIMLIGGFSVSLINIIFAVFSWFVVRILEVFLGQPKAST